jgi:23S rRNA (cytosine1962-C5)-methyltransferase
MLEAILANALDMRASLGLSKESEAFRLFYGPGETRDPSLSGLALDLFLDQLWITAWKPISPEGLSRVIEFVRSRTGILIRGAVLMDRSRVASDADSVPVFGEVRKDRFQVREFGVPYLVQMEGTKHPGLFLDHSPLRRWLLRTQTDKKVLNLFSYTGALSVAAARGGASEVTTLDLSRPTIDWAKESWVRAGLESSRGDFIFGDVFDWLPRLQKKDRRFDTILCDPPSFSRTKSGTFSTGKDLRKLHELILPLLTPGGILVTSINSENVSERAFLSEITEAAERCRLRLEWLGRIDLPESFPTGPEIKERYLKGFYLRVSKI